MKMPNDKCYLQINDTQLSQYVIDQYNEIW